MLQMTRNTRKAVFWCNKNLTSCFGHWSKSCFHLMLVTSPTCQKHHTSSTLNQDQVGSRQIKQEAAANSAWTSAVTGLKHGVFLRGHTACSFLCRCITLPFCRAYCIYSTVSLLGAAPACSFTVNYIARNTAAPTATFLLHYNYFLKMTLGPRYITGEKWNKKREKWHSNSLQPFVREGGAIWACMLPANTVYLLWQHEASCTRRPVSTSASV